MKDKKVFIIVICVLALFTLSIMAIVISNNLENNGGVIDNPTPPNNISNGNNNEIVYDYLIINDTDMWGYNNGEWKDIKNFISPKEKYNVYVNNVYYGNYYLTYINSWNLLNDYKEYIDYEGSMLAFKDLDIKLNPFSKINVTDIELNEIANILGVKQTIFTTNELINIDIDNNGISDKIVNVANLDYDNGNPYFHLLYIVLNEQQFILINNVVDEKDLLIKPRYSIEYILNINNMDSIILEVDYLSNSGSDYNIMYQYKNNEFIKVVGD